MENLLIISNCAISKSESNGRISVFSVKKYNPNKLSNFYLRGVPDYDSCDYLTISPKKALISKLTFGLVKAKLVKPQLESAVNTSLNPKSKKPFYHVLRSFAFIRNRSLVKQLSFYIKKENINKIMLWGCNVPFIYYLAWKLSKKCNIELVTFTGEDYPLKEYNYINQKRSLNFNIFQKSLRKHCEIAYKMSSENIYATEDLKVLYEEKIGLENGGVSYFKSSLKKAENVNKNYSIKNILYGGNLYDDRVKSLLEVAEYLEKFSSVKLSIYGSASDEILSKLKQAKNINYYGTLPFEELVSKIYEADLLLHIEGFSDEYIKDCKYAFSTKIADYFMANLPFFVYGPEEISGVKFCKGLIPDFVAVSHDELSKLDSIILKEKDFDIDYSYIKSIFGD